MATKFKITVWGPVTPKPEIPIVHVVVYYMADNSFAAFQYAKAVAGDYYGSEMDLARYTIEEISTP